MEALGSSHILSAEGEKLQYILESVFKRPKRSPGGKRSAVGRFGIFQTMPNLPASSAIMLQLFAAIAGAAVLVGGGAGASLTIIRLDGASVASGSQSDGSEHDADIQIKDE